MKHLKSFNDSLSENQSICKTFYRFKNSPDKNWVDDNDRSYSDDFFSSKEYDEYEFNNFLDMDRVVGHEHSLFGTRGLPVGDPKRSSRSFDMYNKQFGPMIVRVIK